MVLAQGHSTPSEALPIPLRILFLTLEFQSKTFSGNGIAAMSQARSLRDVGHHVLVLSASPEAAAVTLKLENSQQEGGSLRVIEVPVSSWGKLDSSAPWQEFQTGMTDAGLLQAVRDFNADVAMVVDWSGLPAWQTLRSSLSTPIPYVWINFRVFTRTETGAGYELVRRLESEAMAGALCTVVLSRSDKQFLTDHVMHPAHKQTHDIHVLLCALRGDMKHISQLPPLPIHTDTHTNTNTTHTSNHNTVNDHKSGSNNTAHDNTAHDNTAHDNRNDNKSSDLHGSSSGMHQRRYLTCVVRLAPEKEPLRFVELVGVLERRGTLQRLGLVPLMAAAATDPYAQDVKSQFKSACPQGVLLEEFMGPHRLAEIYAATRLNIHPATYDAFGMTIVEAASQGCPSLVHDGSGAVGATDLLRASQHEVILIDMKQDTETLVTAVEALLADNKRLERVGQLASDRARSWDEETHAKVLVQMTVDALAKGKRTDKTSQPVREEL